jgi:Na+-driven multidrug efflux pump
MGNAVQRRPALNTSEGYCRWVAPLFAFLAALFVANACSNTLGKPHYSTWFNWLRATLGTVPFVLMGAWIGGPKGILVGNMAGGIAFGFAAVWLCVRLIDTVAGQQPKKHTS